jgi:hypothetical protein
MDVLVNVAHQQLRVATYHRKMIAGSQEFIRFVFNFDEGWDDLLIFAQFIQSENSYNVYLDEENSCYLPPEIVPGLCLITLYGVYGDKVATTDFLVINIQRSIMVENEQSTDISPSQYHEFVNMLDSINVDENGIVNLIGSDSGQSPQTTTPSLYQQLTEIVRSIDVDNEGYVNLPET